MTASPTSRSLDYCRRQGWPAGSTEKWVPFKGSKPGRPGNGLGGIRRDLFGFIDLVVLVLPQVGHYDDRPPPPSWQGLGFILGVQACAGASHAARADKVRAAPVLASWYACGGRVEVWSWTKAGPRGKRKRWTLRREAVQPAAVP